jgi:hypothetical protein
MVGGPQDLDAVADKVGVGVAQGRIAADLERDVTEANLPALRALRCLRLGVLTGRRPSD